MIRWAKSRASLHNPRLGMFIMFLAIVSAVISIVGNQRAGTANETATHAIKTQKATITRLQNDEACLRSVVAQQSVRSNVLTMLGNRRDQLAINRQAWITKEQVLTKQAFKTKSPAGLARIEKSYSYALSHYLTADRKWHLAQAAYLDAQQRHPVPKLDCTAGHLDQPAPVVTKTSHAPAPPAKTKTVTSTATTTRPAPPPVTVTVTSAPPGKRHGRR